MIKVLEIWKKTGSLAELVSDFVPNTIQAKNYTELANSWKDGSTVGNDWDYDYFAEDELEMCMILGINAEIFVY